MDNEMITSVDTSLIAVQEYFNTHKDKIRFVALVSPT